MKVYSIFRYGKCMECGNIETKILGTVKAETMQDAINKGVTLWEFNNFGNEGATRPFDKVRVEAFLNAEFYAQELREV